MTDLQWARVSNDAFNVALFAYLASMLGYFVFLAFKREGVWQVVEGGGGRGRGREPRRRSWRAGSRPTACRGATCTSTPRCWRMLVVVGALVVVEGVYKVRSLTGFALMFSVLTMAVAVSFLYVGPGPLVPALNSYWIKIHVQAAIWGSSLFALGGIATIAYLVVDRSRAQRRLAALGARTPPPIMGGSIDLDAGAPPPRRARRPGARLGRGRRDPALLAPHRAVRRRPRPPRLPHHRVRASRSGRSR